jgi:hypothetical protein
MKEIGQSMGPDFSPYVGDLCPYLLEIVETNYEKEKASLELIQNTLACVDAIVPCLGGHIHVILPPILTILDSKMDTKLIRKRAINTLILIARNHSISDRASAIMQTWLRCIREKELQEHLITLLMLVMTQVRFFL